MGQAFSSSDLACSAGVTCIGFDQQSTDIIAAGMMQQHANDVAPLPGTQADRADPTRGCLIDRIWQM